MRGTVKYMEYSFEPEELGEGAFLQVPTLSHEKSVTLATAALLDAVLEKGYQGLSKKHALDALERFIVISSWSDYSKMVFEGKEFSGKNGDWV
ncbi:hypothetical protein BTM36_04540 [Herbaspirillum sp. VT-16-41]|nr:hypothetical protein BTM36_04540 [Herbaspirillum sp. VT-16-41]